MTINGGSADEPTSFEPTSYGLKPPAPTPREVPAARELPASSEVAASREVPEPPEVPQPRTETVTQAQTDAPAPASAPAPAAESDAGRLVGGRYRLLERLGFGGMGTVWRARDEVVDRDVAIKEPRIPDHLSASERATVYLRMQREARAAARIDHPSVVTVHDVVTEGERPWIVMELVRGRSLAEVLEEGTLPPREAARIGLAVLGALAAAHEAGVLHRDVKPANVLLGRYDRVVLTDFGIAHVEGEAKLTETGAFIGSPEYIAPERVLGQRPGPESDLWSLGVVLYQAVEGVSPFRRQTTPSTMQAILLAELQRPAHTGALTELVTGLLRKEPSARPTAVQAEEALRAVAHPKPQARTALMSEAVRGANGAGDGTRPLPARVLRTVRTSRRAQLGLGAVALAAVLAVLYTVVDPFGGGGPPAGYKAYDETRMDAALAVPARYVRSADDGAVTFTDPDKVFSVKFSKAAGVKDSALTSANASLAWYKAGGQQNYSRTVDNADGKVLEDKQQGRDAAVLDVGYTDLGDQAKPSMRLLELYVLSGKGDRYVLTVEMPAAKEQSAEGKRIFDNVKSNLEITSL
ncbi:serine/threonine-protein kinase [Streptomyces sp. H10-C2]|uniref:serine/threonine-protein kinase n=1 Tax=unclassified Streptomyces TaxID=2593676 RepID=UPI0024BA26DF|nr:MULTISPECIES: serine/threonine-protein kinase [unclassified Streptomyces]MDJ0340585.1 serine/threonine-protein kinase [Streptomyces sp. PH10-H1]MDJ0370233.1 serine/threonine-protein kinase [Streptomyces sp. H10-C2]